MTICRGKGVFFLQMVQFNWSILVDAADVEVVLMVLEIPDHNCLLEMKAISPFYTQTQCVTQISVDFCWNFERSKLRSQLPEGFSLLQHI